MTALLEVDGLESGYGDALVLRGVSLRARSDEIVSLIGPNGAGKSTLLKTIYGLVPARAGTIRLLGREITRMRADRLTHAGVNFVPQVDNVFPSLSVAENLKVSVLPMPRAERRDALARVEALFPIVRERARQRAGIQIARHQVRTLDQRAARLAPRAPVVGKRVPAPHARVVPGTQQAHRSRSIWRTGAKERRWISQAPYRASRARCSAVA